MQSTTNNDLAYSFSLWLADRLSIVERSKESPMTEQARDTPVNDRPAFDPTLAEDALQQVMEKMFGGGIEIFESTTPGVIAFERIWLRDAPGSTPTWQEVASAIAIKTGYDVLAIAHCDWTFDDRPDEEAILMAFDIPELPEDYRSESRNMIFPVEAATAPTAEDFAAYRKATALLEARSRELSGRIDQLVATETKSSEIEGNLAELNEMREAFQADDKEIVAQVLKLDFDGALETFRAAQAASPAP
ncbi:hypothetical protein [Bosea sp. RAC05]|uniref:hypothetical protein n=1 Tax=Bosea sp. RAC05 TaxID=1842539 RepID=UPI00085583F0|nr:hypothetical protein [Bosea sp. RAC05]AOG03427.1 hypothetical protein BSY19_5045 [Bosea sp. RAC05]